MRKTTTYSPEVRERAVRMVLEHMNDYPSEWAAIEAIARRLAVQRKPCTDGFVAIRPMPASVRGLPAKSMSASRP